MITMRLTLKAVTPLPVPGNLERTVANFIQEWHNEDNLQEVLNMAMAANNIRANVFKIGGPPDTLAFQVEPFPNPGFKASGKKLNPGYSK